MRMKAFSGRPLSLGLALFVAAAGAPPARSQTQSSPRQPTPPPARSQPPTAQPTPTPQGAADAGQDEVIQVTTELVQTGVAVFDKSGKFVEGLRREQFEVLVDGKPRPVDFLERVIAGTRRERSQVAAARDGRPTAPPTREEAAANTATTDAGRTVFFLVDDLHLSAENLGETRKTITRFVESSMGQNDRAAVSSVSGRIGFLQQLTDHKPVLRAAVERIVPRPTAASAINRPYITAYQAIAVEENNERGVLEYLVGELRREEGPDLRPDLAEQIIRTRTRGLVQEAEQTNRLTLASLEGLMRSAAEVPGRKVIFFLSDGFVPLSRNADERARMRRVVDAAARTGSVIYTVHTRGLATDPNLDASRSIIPDPFGISGANSSGTGELMATLEPLRALAEDTGGRAIINTNALDAGIARSLEETSRYYLLAWRPDAAAAGAAGAYRRVEVKIAGRPELSVRLHRGFLSGGGGAAAGGEKSAAATANTTDTKNTVTTTPAPAGQPSAQPSPGRPAKTPQAELRAAVAPFYPKSDLPVFVSASFHDEPGRGPVVTVSVRVQSETLSFNAAGGKRAASVDLACFVFDADGKQAGGGQDRLDVSAPAAADAPVPRRNIIYNYQTALKPGLYQVRAAARDAGGGRVGVATEWIEIPDLKKNRLALGSLLVAAVESGAGAAAAGADAKADAKAAEAVRLAVGEGFPRGSRLRFYTNVYNAARGAGGPDVSVQVKVLHRDRVIFDTGQQKLSADASADAARLPYAAEVNFGMMPAGRYLLQLTATDNAGKQSAVQFARFEIR